MTRNVLPVRSAGFPDWKKCRIQNAWVDDLTVEHVVDRLDEGIFHLEHANFIPTPSLATFEMMMKSHVVDAADTVFFEDSPRNLKPAYGLGMKTVLVGPNALDNTDDFVDFRSPSLKAFLTSFGWKTA